MNQSSSVNVLGTALHQCGCDPMTGFYRDGYCHTDYRDQGVHSVCCVVSAEFLEFSKDCGNDLSTPRAEFGFPGLQPGDNWCLCAGRWLEAYHQNKAPLVHLESTHEETLAIIPLEYLKNLDFKRDK